MDMTTPEGNKLIAEFMDHDREYMKDTPTYGDYHTSWDWLMPVVEKIGKVSPYIIHENGIRISDAGITYKRHPTIEAVWNGVVLYIQWYNQNSTINLNHSIC